MTAQIQLGDLVIEVVFKDIKNVHLSVHPPAGRVSIAAPLRMNLDTVRVFAIAKLDWIRRQQKKIREQDRETEREYLDRESHYLWGNRHLLSVVEHDEPPSVEVKHNKLVLHVRPGTTQEKREAIVEGWYREQVKQAAPALIAKWEPPLNVKVGAVPRAADEDAVGELQSGGAQHPSEHRSCKEAACVPRIHRRSRDGSPAEPTHNPRFVSLMDRYMPQWRFHREVLNRLPVRHENWEY